ncbi:hypothetical protein KET34_05190 [Paenibacillus pabuli]|nr:hypothetical protein KET34_05190 [Paenibacillus pabuli]
MIGNDLKFDSDKMELYTDYDEYKDKWGNEDLNLRMRN